MFRAYQSVGKSFRNYLHLYGGWSEVLRSPYLHVAAVVSILCWWFWARQPWFDVVIQTLPNIIGFSIGAFAIWLGFGDDRFRRIFAEREKKSGKSSYLVVTASFAHFVIVQVFALMWAVVAKALAFDPATVPAVYNVMAATGMSPQVLSARLGAIGGFIGFWVFCYALLLGVATVFGIMRLASLFQRYADACNVKPSVVNGPSGKSTSSADMPTGTDQ